MLLVDRRRAATVFWIVVAALSAISVVLVRLQRAVLLGVTAEQASGVIEVLSGVSIFTATVVIIATIVALKRSIDLKRALGRALHRDRTRAIGSHDDPFAGFGELGAAIGSYGRALERRSRAIIGRLDAAEHTVVQILASVEDEVVVLDGAGRVYAASPSAERLIQTDTDGARTVQSEPSIRTVLRALLIDSSVREVTVGKTKLYLSPVSIDRSDGKRSIVYLVLSRYEGVKRQETVPKPEQRGGEAAGFFRTILDGLRPGSRRR